MPVPLRTLFYYYLLKNSCKSEKKCKTLLREKYEFLVCPTQEYEYFQYLTYLNSRSLSNSYTRLMGLIGMFTE